MECLQHREEILRKIYLINPKDLPNKGFSWEKAYKYAKLMEQGVDFPPVNVYPHPENNSLTYNDGRTRVAAAKMAGVMLKVTRYFKD